MPTIISRNEARARGEKRFYTGKPCKAGHLSERYTTSGGCIECVTYTIPNKVSTPVNGAWPLRAFVFETQPVPTAREMVAALRYIEAQKWHDVALQQLRANPQLMAEYVVPPTPAELEAARALLAQAEPVRVKTGGLHTPEAIAARNARLAASQK